MKNKYIFVTVMLLGILLLSGIFTTVYVNSTSDNKKDDKITIVTSFYPMYIATMNIVEGAEGVELENLSQPQTGCLHDFQLTPQDMKLLSTADAFVVNGGGIESFLTDVANAYPKLKLIEACEEVELLTEGEDQEHVHEDEDTHEDKHVHEEEHAHQEEHAHEEEHDHSVNAHAWMSVSLYRIQVATIARQLSQLDPANADIYQENATAYDARLAKLEEQQKELVCSNENVILFHEAYGYVAADYGMNPVFLMDLDEERQVSAGEVAEVVTQIRENKVRFILAEELYGREMGNTVEKETEVKVLYIDPLNKGEYDKDSYIEGMQKNIDILKAAFSGKE